MSRKITKGARRYLLRVAERIQYGVGQGEEVRHFNDPTAKASTRGARPIAVVSAYLVSHFSAPQPIAP